MVAKVQLTYTVEAIIKGEDEDQIADYISCSTPSEVVDDAQKQGNSVYEFYEEEILKILSDEEFTENLIDVEL